MGLLRDSSKIFTGQVIQRLISVLLIPITARLIGPDDYGIVHAATSVFAIAAVFGSFALEASIPVAESEINALQRAVGTIFIGMIFSLIFGFISYILKPFILNYLSVKITLVIIFLSPVYITLMVATISLQNYVGYLGKFTYFPIADVSSLIAGFLALLSSYFFLWQDYRCLILGGITTFVTKLCIYFYATRGHRKFHFEKGTTVKEIRDSIWSARNFAKYNFPANLLNSSSANLPITLISMFFAESVVGLFAMARSIIYIPTQLSGQALGQVFYPKASKAYREGKGLKDITWRTFIYSCQMALYPSLLIGTSAWFVLPLILGPKWSGIGLYCLLILPMVLFNAVQTQIGIGFIFSIINQQHKILIGNIGLFIGRFLPLLICVILFASPYIAVFAHSMGGAVIYILLLVWVFITVSINPVEAFYVWLKYTLISLMCVAPIGLSIILPHNVILLSFSLTLSIILYASIGWFQFLSAKQRSIILNEMHKLFPFLKKVKSMVSLA